MPRVVQSEQAERDLEQILEYVDNLRPAAAVRLARSINEKCDVLAQFPEIGRAREDLSPGLRSFSVGKYMLFYRATIDGIEVIRILHGNRDISSLFD